MKYCHFPGQLQPQQYIGSMITVVCHIQNAVIFRNSKTLNIVINKVKSSNAWEHYHLKIQLQVEHHPDLTIYQGSFVIAFTKLWNYCGNKLWNLGIAI